MRPGRYEAWSLAAKVAAAGSRRVAVAMFMGAISGWAG
jgi:hypothetical protein